MLTAAEIRLVAGILLALLTGWAVSAWRDRQREETTPKIVPLQLKTPVKHFDHLEE